MAPSIQFASGLYKAIRTGVKYNNLLVPNAPYLALCGDVATTECKKSLDFLSWCSQNYEQVIWIPGWYEMGGYKGKPRLMIEQLDQMYRFVRSHDLLNIVIGNKTELCTKDMLILATPLFLLTPSIFCNSEIQEYSEKVVTYNANKELQLQISPITFQDLEGIYRSEYDWILKKSYYHKLHKNNMPIVVISGSMTHLLGCEPQMNFPGIYNIIQDSPICLNLHGADFRNDDGGNTSGYAEDNVWYGVNDYRYINYDPHKSVGVQKREMK
jgi:hypothetical protein